MHLRSAPTRQNQHWHQSIYLSISISIYGVHCPLRRICGTGSSNASSNANNTTLVLQCLYGSANAARAAQLLRCNSVLQRCNTLLPLRLRQDASYIYIYRQQTHTHTHTHTHKQTLHPLASASATSSELARCARCISRQRIKAEKDAEDLHTYAAEENISAFLCAASSDATNQKDSTKAACAVKDFSHLSKEVKTNLRTALPQRKQKQKQCVASSRFLSESSVSAHTTRVTMSRGNGTILIPYYYNNSTTTAILLLLDTDMAVYSAPAPENMLTYADAC